MRRHVLPSCPAVPAGTRSSDTRLAISRRAAHIAAVEIGLVGISCRASSRCDVVGLGELQWNEDLIDVPAIGSSTSPVAVHRTIAIASTMACNAARA